VLVHRQFLAPQHRFPAPVAPLVEERARTVDPYLPHTRIKLFSTRAHGRQAGLLNNRRELLLRGHNLQEADEVDQHDHRPQPLAAAYRVHVAPADVEQRR
jgi:hypothetical protein